MKNNSLIKDLWLSDNLGVESYYIKKGINEFEDSLDSSVQFCYAKINTTDYKSTIKLQSLGFNLIETSILLSKKIDKITSINNSCRFAKESDIENIDKIASTEFSSSRFYKDPNISIQISSKLKSNWALNYFKGGRGDQMIVKEINNAAIGFLQLIIDKNNLFIDLIAVKEEYRGKGNAIDMINFAVSNFKGSPYKIYVGTQLDNLTSLKFYLKNGFQIESSEYVYHYHSKK